MVITDLKQLAEYFLFWGKFEYKTVLINEIWKQKRLPKYNKNENKLYLKEDLEKSKKTRGKTHRRLKKQHDVFKKRSRVVICKKTKVTQKECKQSY